MSIASEVSVSQQVARSGRQAATRAALAATGTIVMLVSSARISAAQTPAQNESRLEIRVTGGGLLPVGGQRNVLDDAKLTAAQVSWAVRPSLAITGTFGWARSRDIVSVGSPKLDVFTSDIGVEARHATRSAGRAVTFSPFAGAGAGARSYNYRKLDVDATHNLAAYASVGGELGIKRVGLRLEMRDYATGFKPLAGVGRSDTRNDVVIMATVKLNRGSR